jgi:hypothetical protein
MEAGVSRDDVLHILGRKIDDSEVQHWGIQCNRAIRILFPHVQMKRKGKYKTYPFFLLKIVKQHLVHVVECQ